MMSDSDGLRFAYVLDGKGGGLTLDWQGVQSWRPEQGVLWVHLDRTDEDAQRWVLEENGIDRAFADTLIRTEGNRPRSQRVGDALLISLRSVSRNRDEPADDIR